MPPVTPNSVDQYSRFMDELFDEREIIKVDTVFQQFFGQPEDMGSKTIYSPDSEVVEIEITRTAGEKYAKLIPRGTNSQFLNLQKNVSDINWSNFSRVYPLAEELSDITASQINKRIPGENSYERMSKQKRMREAAQKHHAEHIRRYVRLFEVLAGLSLLGGAHPALLGSANLDNWYDFRRNAALIVTPTTPWDQPGADIMGDWDTAIQTLREIGKVKPDMAIAGANVIPVIFNDATIQAWADNRGYNVVRVGANNWTLPSRYQRYVDAGLDPLAWFRTPRGKEFYLFGYSGIVTDDNGVVQNLMPVNTMWFAFSGARADRYFGPSEVLPTDPVTAQLYQHYFGLNMMMPTIPARIKNPAGIVTPQMFHCDAVFADDRKKTTIRTQSAPIFSTTQTDAYFTYYGCLSTTS